MINSSPVFMEDDRPALDQFMLNISAADEDIDLESTQEMTFDA